MPRNSDTFPSATSIAALFWIGVMSLFFGGLLCAPFVRFDDSIHVLKNPLMEPEFRNNLIENWKGPYMALYIPVTYTFWQAAAAIHRIFSKETFAPALFHFLNVGFHILNTFLLFQFLRRVRFSLAYAAVGASFFAFHPLNVEAVAWVSGFRDVLMVSFSLLSFHLIVNEKMQHSWAIQVLVLLIGVIALLCKPSAVVLPLVWFFLLVRTSLLNPKSMRLIMVALLLSFPVLLLTRGLQTEKAFSGSREISVVVSQVISNLGFYVSKTLIPIGLAFRYEKGSFLVGALSLLFFLVVAVGKGMKWGAGLWVFGIALLPVLGFVPYVHQLLSPVADRYAYFATVGVAVFLAHRWEGWQLRFSKIGFCLALVMGLVLNLKQQSYWHSDFVLMERAATVAPTGQSLFNLASARRERWREEHPGEKEPQALQKQLEEEYRLASFKDPKLPQPYLGLGALLMDKGHWQEAETKLRKALEWDPHYADAHNTLALLLAQTNRQREAKEHFLKAVQFDPRNAGHHANLGLLYEDHQEWKNALDHFTAAKHLWEFPPPWLEDRIRHVTAQASIGKKEVQPE